MIGETPHSGNYILIATDGECAGQVFEFDHDGFEFTHAAEDLVDYVQRLLHLDSPTLANIASHMRFIDKNTGAVVDSGNERQPGPPGAYRRVSCGRTGSTHRYENESFQRI